MPQRPSNPIQTAIAEAGTNPIQAALRDPPVEQGLFAQLLGLPWGETWPARMAQSAWQAFTLPGDVYAGRVDPNSMASIGRATDLAGFAALGGTAAPRGALGSGLIRPPRSSRIDDVSATSGSDMATDYRGMHKAPGREENSPLSDLAGTFGEDIYGPRAAQFFGHAGAGDPLDESTARILRQFRGKPDAVVTIYRAVPKSAPDKIIPGDWVTVNPKYAKQHGEGTLQGDYKIISKTVRADEIFTDGNSMHEFGYDPIAGGGT